MVPLAFENLVARDVIMAGYIRGQAETLGLHTIDVEVDTLPRIPEIVTDYFKPMLE